MMVKAGRHQLTGIVSLGQYNNDMEKIKAGISILMLNRRQHPFSMHYSCRIY